MINYSKSIKMIIYSKNFKSNLAQNDQIFFVSTRAPKFCSSKYDEINFMFYHYVTSNFLRKTVIKIIIRKSVKLSKTIKYRNLSKNN